jgi:hypothetical protein
VNPECNELLKVHMIVAALPHFLHPFGCGAMNPHGYQRVFVGRISRITKGSNHLRRNAVNAESHKFVAVSRLDP